MSKIKFWGTIFGSVLAGGSCIAFVSTKSLYAFIVMLVGILICVFCCPRSDSELTDSKRRLK